MDELVKRFSSAADGAMMLPRSAIKHLKDASASDLKALIYICSADGVFEDAQACEECGITQDELRSAIGFWRGAKVLKPGQYAEEIPNKASLSKVNTMQQYDTELLTDAKTKDKDFAAACFVCERAFEKHTLTRNDLNALFYLYNFVGIPFDLLCAQIEYCAENGKRSMQYLVKTSIGMFEDDGIDTEEKFSEYLRLRSKVTDGASQLKKLLGIGDRAFTTKQSGFVERWFAQRQYSFELVRYAYDLTVDKLDRFVYEYADAILERWYSEGITTVERAEKDHEDRKGTTQQDTAETFDFDELFEIAQKRKLD